MFLVKTFKARLMAVTLISISSFLFLGIFFYNVSSSVLELEEIRHHIISIENTILELRRNEKDFLARKNLKYQEKHNKNFQKVLEKIATVKEMFIHQNIDETELVSLNDIVKKYSAKFRDIVEIQKTIGLHPKDGLYGALRKSVHDLEDLLKQGSQYELQVDMLMLRRAEKDFMLREDLKYLEKFKKSYRKFLDDLEDVDYGEADTALPLLYNYEKDFYKLIEGYKAIGLTPETGILGEMRKIVHQKDTSVEKLVHIVNTTINNKEAEIKILTIIIFIILFLIVAIYTYLVSRKINSKIKEISSSIHAVSMNKDLSIQIHGDEQDEISILSRELNSLFSDLKDVIEDAKGSSSKNSSISQQLSEASIQVGDNIEKSVVIINEATEKTNVITDEIMVSIEASISNKTEMLKANEMLHDARTEVVTMTSKVQASAESEEELSHNIEALSKDMDQVKDVLSVISDIADQTNLLALNAAIEAARAGEHGRGFAVVADEVRKLAERTQKTLTEINATINVIVQATNSASEQMSFNSKKMSELLEISNDVEDKINKTTDIVNNATQASDKTVQDFESAGTRISSISKRINEINTISTKNARNIEEVASLSDNLNNMTNMLTEKLKQFRT